MSEHSSRRNNDFRRSKLKNGSSYGFDIDASKRVVEPTASLTARAKLLSAGWTTTDNIYWTEPITGFLRSWLVALHLLKDTPVSGNELETAFPVQQRGAKKKAVTKQPRKKK